jgi:hypothetical protein
MQPLSSLQWGAGPMALMLWLEWEYDDDEPTQMQSPPVAVVVHTQLPPDLLAQSYLCLQMVSVSTGSC